MKNEKCLIRKHHSFLWWKWKTEHYHHLWNYTKINETFERKCDRCGIEEIYFGVEYSRDTGAIIGEDWRPKKQ